MSDWIRIDYTMRPTAQDLVIRAIHGEEAYQRRMRLVMGREGSRLAKLSREEAPKRSGAYAKSIKHKTYQTGDVTGFAISSARPLGKYIQEGTRAHTIRARHARVLRFYWAKGPRGAGIYHFRQVQHPGTKPNNFYLRAIVRWKATAKGGFAEAAKAYGEALAGR